MPKPAPQQDLTPPDESRAGKLVTAGPPAAQAGGILTVDLGAIEANWRALGRRAMPAECAAVIKADGYGCGIEQVAAALAKAGCKTFFVADLAEARRVRAVAPEPAIYVLNGLLPGTAAALRRYPRAAGDRQHGRAGGMGRLCVGQPVARRRRAACGHRHEPARYFGQRGRRAGAAHPLRKSRHHAADEPPGLRRAAGASAQRAPDQRRSARCACLYRGIPSSLANSSGIFLGATAHCDMVRPGVALYGVNPTPGRAIRCAR